VFATKPLKKGAARGIAVIARDRNPEGKLQGKRGKAGNRAHEMPGYPQAAAVGHSEKPFKIDGEDFDR
jgi:hypothetical protein